MSSESEKLRQALFALAVNKKCEQVQQRMYQKLNAAMKEWNDALYGYLNVIAKLNTLIQLAEQQEHISLVRASLKNCSEMAKTGNESFDRIWRLVEMSLPITTMDQNYIKGIINNEQKLVEIKEKLQGLLLFSSDRESIETVQQMMVQINEVQSKINILSNKVRETVDDVIRIQSRQFDDIDKAADEEDGSDDSRDMDNSV